MVIRWVAQKIFAKNDFFGKKPSSCRILNLTLLIVNPGVIPSEEQTLEASRAFLRHNNFRGKKKNPKDSKKPPPTVTHFHPGNFPVLNQRQSQINASHQSPSRNLVNVIQIIIDAIFCNYLWYSSPRLLF